MLRMNFCLVLLVIVIAPGAVSKASAAEPLLISETVAQQHGLERSWFAQADIDHGRSRLQDMNLYEGVLYLISDSAMVQAIDAETGATLWSKRIGQPKHPCLPLGVGGDMLAVVNGSRLYVANRYNGAIIYEHVVDGAPGGGPAVNDCRVYVPMTTGMIVAYRVDLLYDVNKETLARKNDLSPEELRQFEALRRQKIRVDLSPAVPAFFRSKGRTLVQPLVMRQSKEEEYVSWPTDEGYLYIAQRGSAQRSPLGDRLADQDQRGDYGAARLPSADPENQSRCRRAHFRIERRFRHGDSGRRRSFVAVSHRRADRAAAGAHRRPRLFFDSTRRLVLRGCNARFGESGGAALVRSRRIAIPRRE